MRNEYKKTYPVINGYITNHMKIFIQNDTSCIKFKNSWYFSNNVLKITKIFRIKDTLNPLVIMCNMYKSDNNGIFLNKKLKLFTDVLNEVLEEVEKISKQYGGVKVETT